MGWIWRDASFETPAARAPQDEAGFSMPTKIFLMLRGARRARLEARFASMQLGKL
jgi:hypothetical protein